MDRDMSPEQEQNESCELFAGATICKENENILFTDLTGKFLVQSYKGNKQVFVAYAMHA
jgi:hypothetical protein